MTDSHKLRREALELGLEDVIPLPELAQDTCLERDGALGPLIDVLIELLREGRIQVWSGTWPDEPEVVRDPAVAEELLRVEDQYEFNSPADLRLRVYYVNVDNIKEPDGS